MAIDYSGDGGLLFPKSRPRVLDRIDKTRHDAETEKRVKAEVRARDGGRCQVPGCKSMKVDVHHIVKRSRSKALKFEASNLVCLCAGPGTKQHHQLADAGLITFNGRPGTASFQVAVTRQPVRA